MINTNPRKNAEGYDDPTAFAAIKNVYSKDSKPKVSEACEQANLIEWASWNLKKYPDLWFLHAIPNGGSRHKGEAANLKKQGVKPGVSDLFLPVACGEYHGMYIEMKRIGGRVEPEQKTWINRVREQGYFAVVAYGFEDAKRFIEWYLSLSKS